MSSRPLLVTPDGMIVTETQAQSLARNGARYSSEVIRRKSVLRREPVRADEDGVAQSCPICYENYTEVICAAVPGCNHQFHIVCIERWLEEKNTCPMCNTPITP